MNPQRPPPMRELKTASLLGVGLLALALDFAAVLQGWRWPVPASLAVLAIFSTVWRWNDFLWPLVVLSSKQNYTLQVGLNTYAGELNVRWHFILAMTVAAMIPVVIVFVFLQRYITAGIAGTGLK